MEASTLSLRGKLLVATPPLIDPNFDRTVVLLLEHGDDGALGVVLNRPSETPVDDVLPEWRPFSSAPDVVFVGGPVSPDAVIALAQGGPRHDERLDGWNHVLPGLATIDLAIDPLDLGAPLDQLRVFVGYAGWSAGQLESELDEHGWFVVDAQPSDPFTDRPETLWRTVLRRQRRRVSVFANYPEDPSIN